MKEILTQDANVALLVDHAIHHHQLRFRKLLHYLTAPADYLDARATKFQIFKISYQFV